MSNKVGEIYGSSVNGRPSIKIDSSNLDVTGDLLTKGIIKFSVTNNVLASEDPSGIIHRLDTLDNSINILDNSINTLTNSINTLTNSVNILDNSVNTLLTSNNDACFNNVDVSGSLNVQGEKVITVPALDICGNDLSANTTYEITTGPTGNINNISFVKKNSRVYFSVQMRVGASSGTFDGNSYINYLNEVSGDTRSDQKGLAGTAPNFTDSAWDVNSIVSSGGDQSNFPTQGFVVPRTGIYKIDCYQTIPIGASGIAAIGSLLVYRNPIIGNANNRLYPYGPNPGDTANLLAGTEVSDFGESQSRPADASLTWLGQLDAGDQIKFVIRMDNGFRPITALTKGCFTIISVD